VGGEIVMAGINKTIPPGEQLVSWLDIMFDVVAGVARVVDVFILVRQIWVSRFGLKMV
jgi:hypothetical protein